MLEGITAGFILSLTLFPGTVWLVKVGVSGRATQVLAVGLGFACSQLIWLLVAAPGLMLMCRHLSMIALGMHLFAAFVLAYMSFKFFRTRRVERIDHTDPLESAPRLFRRALTRALAMPMRLPAAMAILLATGVFHKYVPEWEALPNIIFGVFIGILWWWGQFTFLSLAFAKRVPQAITIKSLNKIRPFSAVICSGLVLMVLFVGLK